MKISLRREVGGFLFALAAIRLLPTFIPLIEARFFIVAPFNVVGTNHELEIALTARSVDNVIVL